MFAVGIRLKFTNGIWIIQCDLCTNAIHGVKAIIKKSVKRSRFLVEITGFIECELDHSSESLCAKLEACKKFQFDEIAYVQMS